MAQAALNHSFVASTPAEGSAAVDAAVPEILYIMGTGRSGTTILEIILANNPGFTGVGEVKHIFRDGFLRDLPCACGQSGRECELWSAVLRTTRWQHAQWVEWARQIERVESHRHFPLTMAGLPDRRMSAYAAVNRALFASVALTRRADVVVDSSKFAGRALLLARAVPDKVRVLCITRSAAGIIRAFRKKNEGEQRPKGALAVAAYYVYVLLCMRLVKWRLQGRCHAVRFEDLNSDPCSVLDGIEAWSGYSLVAVKSRIRACEWLDVGHIVTGNRLRKSGRVKFEPGPGGREHTPAIGSRMLAAALERYRKLMGF